MKNKNQLLKKMFEKVKRNREIISEEISAGGGGDELDRDLGCELGVVENRLYCDEFGEWKTQLSDGAVCENNFECSSGTCIDVNCVEEGLFQRFILFL